MYYIIDIRTYQTRYWKFVLPPKQNFFEITRFILKHGVFFFFRKFDAVPCEILLPMTPEASSIFGLCSISEMLTPHVFRLGCNVAFPQSHIYDSQHASL